MKSAKPIEISKSSLISLKAELSRKQDEVSKAKLQNQTSVIRPLPRPKKETIWTKQNSGVNERNEKDAEELKEERDIHQLSRNALEAKSKLYDKLSKCTAAEENAYLVDFQQKAATEKQEEEEEEMYTDEPASDPEDDWVDYEDCLGRTRRCLRKDLDFVKQKDAHLFATLFDKKKDDKNATGNENPELQSADMRRELLRQKWEEQEQRLRDKADIHYQDVLFDEARSHGVGYYGFSQDETQRKAQQEALSNLRHETEQKQQAARSLRDRREQQLQARLKAARRRKRARLGLPLDDSDSEEQTDDKVTDDVESKQEEKEEEPVEVVKKPAPVRPWDIGKEGVTERQVLSQEEWVAKKRQERPQDFAPPSSYQPDYIPVSDQETIRSLYFTSKRPRKEVQTPYSNIINEVEEPEKTVKRGTEIAPPASYGASGHSRKPFGAMKGAELENSISAGLKYLRQQAEERQRQSEKGMLDIV